MGKLSRDDILKLATLARLDLTEDEIVEYQEELSAILEYVTVLESVDVTGLKPKNQVTGLTSITRPDEVIDYGYEAATLLENVPSVEDDHIKVKRMVG